MPKKILVVDDNHAQLLMVQSLLESRGYAVITAMNGEEAIEKAVGQKPDLIVLDVQMPAMDGDEAAVHLKSREETKHTPIIFITGLSTEKEIIENREENIFAKPIKLEPFLNKIRELVGD